ncbi:retrotransposon ORF1 [Tanacetum coccineum]
MHVLVGNFTYIADFMIIEDISSIIDPRLSQVVLGKPFVEISNMTHDPPEGVVRFTNGNNEVAYKMPHKIEQYDSLSNLEKVHTKSVYLRNKEDKRRGMEYVMSKILGFYKECLKLVPEYQTGMDDEGEVEKPISLEDSKSPVIGLEKASQITRNHQSDFPVKFIFSSCYLFRNPFSSTTIGDENPIRTLGDYSKPSHEGYRNNIELPSEDPNQHLKDFLKLVDSLDLDGANRERTRLRLFQFSLRDQASNWLEHLSAGSITTWEDLTTRFLAQLFPPGRTTKLRNDILMFQQHHGESLSEA